MEFFDFSGANEEERAQALDVLSRTEDVEFVMNTGPYLPAAIKSQFVYANGERSGEISPPESQHSSMNDSAISNVSSQEEHQMSNNNNRGVVFASSLQVEWPMGDGDNNATLIMQQQAQANVTPMVPYMYPPPHLQAAHYYAPGAIYPNALPPHLAHMHQPTMSYKQDNKRIISSNNTNLSNSYKSASSAKMTPTVNMLNCDMQRNFYMHPTQYPEYGTATPSDGTGLVSDPLVATNGQVQSQAGAAAVPPPVSDASTLPLHSQSQAFYHHPPPVYHPPLYGGYPCYFMAQNPEQAGHYVFYPPTAPPPTIMPMAATVPTSQSARQVALPMSSSAATLSNLSSSSSIPYQHSSNSSPRDTPRSADEDCKTQAYEGDGFDDDDQPQQCEITADDQSYAIDHGDPQIVQEQSDEQSNGALEQKMETLTLNVEDNNDSQKASPSSAASAISAPSPSHVNSVQCESKTIAQQASQSPNNSETEDANPESKQASPWGQSSSKTWASILFASSQGSNAEPTKVIVHEKVGSVADFQHEPQHHPSSETKTHNTVVVRNLSSRNKVSSFDDTSKIEVVSMPEDALALKLARRLRNEIHLKHSLPTILPCGLLNRGNWCYVNATLQALLACPPFYNLMREISETSGIFRQATSTPIIDNFARHFSRFMPKDYKRQLKGANNSFIEELLNQDTYEPRCVYDTLQHIGMIKNDAQKGKQEDAHEFLLSLLNGLDEEMAKLANYLQEKENENSGETSNKSVGINGKSNGFAQPLNGHGDGGDEGNIEEDDTWHEVGTSKYKSMLTRTAKASTTFITEIFGGSMVEARTVNKDTSGNREPFIILPLVIKPSNITTLEDALRWHSRRDKITGYTCSKTKQTVEASCQTFIESSPPILIIQLKLFDFDLEAGTESKILKRIDFPENFEIPRECCSTRDNRTCRRYKLLAVVYHDGPDAYKGHYLSDVYHLGLNQWVRCDDATLNVVNLNKVLSGGQGNPNMKPYMLFYRRQDTLFHKEASASASAAATNTTASSGHNNSSHASKHHHTNNNHSSNHSSSGNVDVTINTSNKFSSISRQF